MATVDELADRLTRNAGIQPSEQISTDLLEEWISDAISRHNANYAVDGSNLPNREVQLVILLAHVSVCNFRASKWADQNNVTGAQGFGQDRNDPFHKNTSQARSLLLQYREACADMGITPNSDIEAGNTLVGGVLTVTDSDLQVRTPFDRDPTPLRKPTLTSSKVEASSFVLDWTKSRDQLFTDYHVFFYEGEQELYQSWNVSSSVFPRISENAVKIVSYTDVDRTALKFVDLQPNTNYSVLVAVVNSNGKCVYSDTLVVKTKHNG